MTLTQRLERTISRLTDDSVAFAAVYFGLLALSCSVWSLLAYLDGWLMGALHLINFTMLALFVLGMPLIVVMRQIYALTRSRSSEIWTVFLNTLLFFLVPGIMALDVVYGPQFTYADNFAAGFVSRLETRVNPDALREWAVGYLDRIPADRVGALPVEEFPQAFREARLESGWNVSGRIVIAGTSSRQVWFHFGGGFHHYGIVVGEKCLGFDIADDWYSRRWVEGVYLFSD